MKNRIIAIMVLIVMGILVLAPMANAQVFYFNGVQSILANSNFNYQWNFGKTEHNVIQDFNNIFYFFTKNYTNPPIEQPVQPTQPWIPEQPKQPEEPAQPWIPEQPEQSEKPDQPTQPWTPEQPKEPEQPVQPGLPGQTGNNSGSNNVISSEESKMLEYINNERAKAGANPLQMDINLAKVAELKSQDMVDKNYFSHTSPTYGSPFEMMNSYGIKYRTAGENIAKNSTMLMAHNALMNSEGHRNNILNPNYTHIGIGIVKNQGAGGITVTQMFIGK